MFPRGIPFPVASSGTNDDPLNVVSVSHLLLGAGETEGVADVEVAEPEVVEVGLLVAA